MIRYVPTSGLPIAQALSDALWGLTVPVHLRNPNGTQRMFGSVTMKDGSVWLAVNTEFRIKVHPDAELGGIAAVMQPWIDEGALPPSTNTDLAALVESLRGESLTPWEAFPQLFKDQSKTREELQAAGLLFIP